MEIQGFYPGSFPQGFIGYYTEERGDKLYVGFRFSTVFGFFETGDFHIRIRTKGEINEVYIKSSRSEHMIWSREEHAPEAAFDGCLKPKPDDVHVAGLAGRRGLNTGK